jgi:hypothetical protein
MKKSEERWAEIEERLKMKQANTKAENTVPRKQALDKK